MRQKALILLISLTPALVCATETKIYHCDLEVTRDGQLKDYIKYSGNILPSDVMDKTPVTYLTLSPSIVYDYEARIRFWRSKGAPQGMMTINKKTKGIYNNDGYIELDHNYASNQLAYHDKAKNTYYKLNCFLRED